MYPRRFKYLRAESVDEAVELLAALGDEARVLAGGISLIPLMKLRLASPASLIDINRLPGLSYIKENGGGLVLGPLTRHVEIETSALVQERFPLMREAARVIGDVQVRNWGTLGGALAEADPSGDWGPVCLALKAEIGYQGPGGNATVPCKDFFLDAFTTVLEGGNVLTEVRIPGVEGKAGGAYLSLKRRAGDYCVVSAAAQVVLGEDGVCREVGLGLAGAGLIPLQPVEAEKILGGEKPSEEAILAAAAEAAKAAEPVSDVRGPATYKREMIQVLVKRALNLALRRCRGEETQG
ncbi:MAG: FAD binding domain-containing protein [Nitrospinota bacterium]